MDAAAKRGLRVYLLGPIRVEVDGRALDVGTWKSKRAVTLLKYLVARFGERVPRDVLVDLLWPDSDDCDKSTHNLHTVIYYLRRTLEPDLGRYEEPRFLRQAHGLYWIDVNAPVWSDAEEFRTLIRRADALRGGDAAQALALYRRALSLYRDDFCSEDLYEDWAVTVRERFRELYFGAAMQAAQLAVEVEGDFGEAVRVCREALAREAYREELHQAVIGYLIQAGRYGEAARQYRTCQRLLEEEFGLSPSPETRALFESMKGMRVESEEEGPAERPGHRIDGAGESTPDGGEDAVVDDAAGPFVCDRRTYSAIFRLELRRQARTGEPIGLLRVFLGDHEPMGPAERRRVERVLPRIIRHGDVVCWESSHSFSVQLPRTDEADVAAVRRRLRRALEEIGFAFVSIEESVIYPDVRPTTVEVR